MKQTKWPLVTFKEIIDGHHCNQKALQFAHKYTLKMREMAEDQSDDERTIGIPKKKTTLMNEAMIDGSTFDAFMDHLMNEYATECLLSIVEFVQFKVSYGFDF